jgi:hypothetical protein
MQLRHFFDGMLRKEEIASAFLATVLEHDASWRRAFLAFVFGADTADELAADPWSASVETDRIDVRLQSPRATVIIENKLNAGAKQRGQLLRYYRTEIGRRGDARVAAVYLAPGEIGRDEVLLVESCAERAARPSDVVRHVSWERLAEIAPPAAGAHDWFIRSGFEQILLAIARAREVKYELLGGRETIRAAVDHAHDLLAARVPDIRVGRFSSSIEEIITYGTPVTMWLQAVFAAEEDPPYTPIDLVHDGHLHVTVRTACKLAGKVKRSSELSARWKELVAAGHLEVPGLGSLALETNGWLAITSPVVAAPEELAAFMAEQGERLLAALRPLFALHQ